MPVHQDAKIIAEAGPAFGEFLADLQHLAVLEFTDLQCGINVKTVKPGQYLVEPIHMLVDVFLVMQAFLQDNGDH